MYGIHHPHVLRYPVLVPQLLLIEHRIIEKVLLLLGLRPLLAVLAAEQLLLVEMLFALNVKALNHVMLLKKRNLMVQVTIRISWRR